MRYSDCVKGVHGLLCSTACLMCFDWVSMHSVADEATCDLPFSSMSRGRLDIRESGKAIAERTGHPAKGLLHAEIVLLYPDLKLTIAEGAALLFQLFFAHLKEADLHHM